MTNNLKKFLIKNGKYRIEEFIGYLPFIILSKEVFTKNTDITHFIEDNFNIVFKQYVYSSRTLLLAKLIRYIFEQPEEKQKMVIQLFCELVKNILDENESKNTMKISEKIIEKPKKKTNKKNDGNNALENWLNNLNRNLTLTLDDLIEKK